MIGCRMSKLLSNILLEIEKVIPTNTICQNLINLQVYGDKLNYLDLDKNGEAVVISYLPSKRIVYGEEPIKHYFSPKRQFGKIGTTLHKILINQDFKDADLKQFVEVLSTEFTKTDYELKIVTGKDITPYYNVDNYIVAEGSELWKNCMRHEQCQSYMGIYENNPNLSLVVALKDGKVAARALLWTGVEIPEEGQSKVIESLGKKVVMLDRIYSITPLAKNVIWQWGLKNADILHYIPKKPEDFFIAKEHKTVEKLRLLQPLKEVNFKYYPYIDTFKYLNFTTNYLSNFDPTKLKSSRDEMIFFGSPEYSKHGQFKKVNEYSPRFEDIQVLANKKKAK